MTIFWVGTHVCVTNFIFLYRWKKKKNDGIYLLLTSLFCKGKKMNFLLYFLFFIHLYIINTRFAGRKVCIYKCHVRLTLFFWWRRKGNKKKREEEFIIILSYCLYICVNTCMHLYILYVVNVLVVQGWNLSIFVYEVPNQFPFADGWSRRRCIQCTTIICFNFILSRINL